MLEGFQVFYIVYNAQINILYANYVYNSVFPLDKFPDLRLQSQRNWTLTDFEKQFQIGFHKGCFNLHFHDSD